MILRNMQIACVFWGHTIPETYISGQGMMGGFTHVLGTHSLFAHVGSVMRVGKVVGLQVLGFQVVGH